MKTSNRQSFNPLIALAIPLCASLIALAIARSLERRAEANRGECAACARAAESLAPYLAKAKAYETAKARLRDAGPIAKAPEPPLGVPPAERATERGTPMDGFASVRETFSWPSLKTGQAFAVLESFSSASPWRIATMRLKALPDGENASLSVTLEGVEPADERRE